MECLELFATQPLLMHLFHEPPDLSFLTELRGNVSELAVVLLLTWTLAAFGEELAWRGYIINRIADMISLPRLRWPIAVVLSSAAFGLAHFNLWLPIVAHGVTDSLDSLLIFSGHYPTM
jgi:membrane protease YdiL (CAAX protease family)